MQIKCNNCRREIEMSSKTCPNCGVDRAAELKHAHAAGAAVVAANLLSILIGFLVAGVDGALCGAGFGMFVAFAAVTLHVAASKVA
jgi:hypothetical protein